VVESSHRERAKARRTKAIELEAMRLFAARGYDQTTVAEIAAAAEVAPRTVSLRFPTKLDIALASTNAAMARLTEQFSAPERSRDVADTVVDWLQSEVALTDPHERELRAAMFRANPALRAMTSVQSTATTNVGIQVLASELGVAADAPVVRTILGAIVGAIQETELSPTVLNEGDDAFETLRTFLRAGIAALQLPAEG
jgi:AcrR family transcriptional regulator